MIIQTSDGRSFAVTCPNLAHARITLQSACDGVAVYHANFGFTDEEKISGHGVTVEFEFPMLGILSTFAPSFGLHRGIKQGWGAPAQHSNFSGGSPMISAVRDGKVNYVTTALSDAVNDSRMTLTVRDFEETETMRVTMTFLAGREHPETYSVDIRIDERPLDMAEVLSSVGDWFRQYYPEREAAPAGSEYPLYSTWYNFHQHPNMEALLPELEVAASLGFRSLIIDDGWSYAGQGTGDYSLCGDWDVNKEKFPDMKAFVDRAHELGILVSLWFPAPFVGRETSGYRDFWGKYLYEWGGAGVLDPRYPDVRSYIADTLAHFLEKYDLDGLKLDFINSFEIHSETPPFGGSMDIPSLNDAVIALMDQIDTRLKAVKPALLMEYRQNYIGPAITRYGNMLRVGDCPFCTGSNRLGVGDLRLLDYRLAVHSDMLYWAKTESVTNVARQLLCTLFAVPQISVLLREVPEDHLSLIRAYLSYWQANRELLLHGRMGITGMDFGYPMLSSTDGTKTIAALYGEIAYRMETPVCDLHNATGRDTLVVVNETGAAASGTVYNLFGSPIDTCAIQPGANLVSVPVGGRVEIR